MVRWSGSEYAAYLGHLCEYSSDSCGRSCYYAVSLDTVSISVKKFHLSFALLVPSWCLQCIRIDFNDFNWCCGDRIATNKLNPIISFHEIFKGVNNELVIALQRSGEGSIFSCVCLLSCPQGLGGGVPYVTTSWTCPGPLPPSRHVQPEP